MADDDERFISNYLILRPENLGFSDFFGLYRSDEFQRRELFGTLRQIDALVAGFNRRWVVFISLFLQRMLLLMKIPMAAVGDAVELFLNFPAANGGYRRLIWNLVTGRLVRPERSSPTFTSVIGCLDPRLELNVTVDNEEDTNKYYAFLAIMASKLAYENSAFAQNVVTHEWQMKFLGSNAFWNDYQHQNTNVALMFQDKTDDPNLIVVAFRGTEPFDADAWRIDVDLSWYEFQGVGRIHGGFLKALGMQRSKGWPKEVPAPSEGRQYAYYSIREKLKSLINENRNAKFLLTGHSLGGALAILFAAILVFHEEELLLEKLEGVYTYGQPRVGDEQFGEYMKAKMSKYNVNYFRFVYSNDIVPRLPFDHGSFFYKHFGPCFYFNSFYRGQVLEEEPNKNYFSLLQLVPKYLNAIFELMRSTLLAWRFGREYAEGWLMKMFRIVALVFPGLTDHGPVDYVNLTRLGKLRNCMYIQNQKQD